MSSQELLAATGVIAKTGKRVAIANKKANCVGYSTYGSYEVHFQS
ncbi:MAG: hypothetical protein V7L27_22900 [Nostoc sp.]